MILKNPFHILIVNWKDVLLLKDFIYKHIVNVLKQQDLNGLENKVGTLKPLEKIMERQVMH